MPVVAKVTGKVFFYNKMFYSLSKQGFTNITKISFHLNTQIDNNKALQIFTKISFHLNTQTDNKYKKQKLEGNKL